jgi:formyl-CoA transferase
VAAVRDVGEVVEDAHLHERGAVRRLEHPQLGPVVVPHSPLRFRGTPPLPLDPSPALGADNDAVYGTELGLGPAELDDLRAEGVI